MQLPMLNADASGPIERGACHVHFGDWREQEPDWPRPFALIMDPPYGQAWGTHSSNGWASSTPGVRLDAKQIIGDGDVGERDAVMNTDGWTVAAVFGPRRIDRIPPWGDPKEIAIWDKAGQGRGDLKFFVTPTHETIAIYGYRWRPPKDGGCLQSVQRFHAGVDKKHPHTKPLPLVSRLVNHVPMGLPIVDPFMGSGTTAVACALLGREFWGAEIDPQYFDVIRGRLAEVGIHV